MARTITPKVSQKQAVSVYGLGRFPVTLYAEQWEALAVALPNVLKFIDDHRDQLATKPERQTKSHANPYSTTV
jgi:hypothetical protein